MFHVFPPYHSSREGGRKARPGLHQMCALGYGLQAHEDHGNSIAQRLHGGPYGHLPIGAALLMKRTFAPFGKLDLGQ